MPKPRKNEVIECVHYRWRLYRRRGIYYADGRSTASQLGRHSLQTQDHDEAKRLLGALDQLMAEEFGLCVRRQPSEDDIEPLTIAEGRRLYEEHISRPKVTGGVEKSTIRKYRSAFDKFDEWRQRGGPATWNQVTSQSLTTFAAYLQKGGNRSKEYAGKTIGTDLTTLMQAINWMTLEGHLRGAKPIKLKLNLGESERAYCWRPEEVKAIFEYCQTRPELEWLYKVLLTLAHTGLRISELVSLRPADIDWELSMLRLTDNSARHLQDDEARRRLKSGRSRSFPIHPRLIEMLKGHTPTGTYLFSGPRGGRVKADKVRRALVQEVLAPLKGQFPRREGERGFADGRLHSFRHYFCSACSNSNVPERMLMTWLGHKNSAMITHYYHLADDKARRMISEVDFLGSADGPSSPEKS